MTTLNEQLQQIADETSQETTLVGSVQTLLDGLRAAAKAQMQQNSVPADTQALVDKILKNASDNHVALTKAITDGTPAAAVDPNASGTPAATGTTGAVDPATGAPAMKPVG